MLSKSPPASAARELGKRGADLPSRVVAALRAILPNAKTAVPLHEPSFEGNEWRYLKECLDSGWVSSAGKYVDRFERELGDFVGAPHAVAVVNGTAALHAALLVCGVEPADEVVVPALTFVATANAVAHCGARPHLADVSPLTLGLDPVKLADHLRDIAEMRAGACVNRRTGARIKAVVPMHTFGHPVDIEPIAAVCERYGLALVEDAAEALGSLREGKHVGLRGRAGVLSFNGNKVITTGGGGAIIATDAELAARAKHLTSTGRLSHPWLFAHDCVAYNYRMPNINAALGCAQLEQLPGFLARKRELAESYLAAFADVPGTSVFREPQACRSNYWLNALLLDSGLEDLRDPILEASNAAGFGVRPAWTLMHRLPMFESCPRMDLSVAQDLEQRLINLPSSASLSAGARA